MIGPLKIWVCFIVIIGVCTAVSGLLWYHTELPGKGNARLVIENLMAKYQVDKQSLDELKKEKPLLNKYVKMTALNEIDTLYKTPDNETLIIENSVNGHITKISYDIDRDGKMEIFEFFDTGNIPVSRQFDVNRDGIIDIIENDYNKDEVLDINELKINIEGQFIPFTTINSIVM
jgi:hypothetical protein